MKEIYRLSIKSIQTEELIRVVCEECSELADYLVNKAGKEKYLCKTHLFNWLDIDEVQYQIH